jgi:hypothetical protein
MLRLELQAQVANLQAEAGAIASEAAVESRLQFESPDAATPDTARPATPDAAPEAAEDKPTA